MENEQSNKLNLIGILHLTTIIDDMWRGLKKFFWLLILLVCLCTGIFYARTRFSYTPSYEAYSSFVVSTSSPYSSSYYNSTTATQLSKTFPYILTSGALSQVVANDLGLSELPVTISAESVSDSALFTIKVTGTDAQLTYDVLQSVIENYPEVADYIIGSTELTLLDESGVPEEPVNPPNYLRGARNGAVIGLFFAIVLLLLYSFTRNTVRRKEDMSARTSIVHLGTVPMIKFKKRGKQQSPLVLLDKRNCGHSLGESFRTIRTRVIKGMEEQKLKTVLVTSAAAGEGKSTVAANLALSLRRQG
ncbi:MAG: hypothetical protein LUF92_13975 [Clostridiales bacterium]|nr:hypothetical protein [Clostridiales bacterium]